MYFVTIIQSFTRAVSLGLLVVDPKTSLGRLCRLVERCPPIPNLDSLPRLSKGGMGIAVQCQKGKIYANYDKMRGNLQHPSLINCVT